MIRKISISNFYSFSKKCTIDFTIHSRAPSSASYFKTSDNQRLSKVYSVTGANASGKTSLLRALTFSCWFARHSYQGQSTTSSEIPYKPFALSSDKNNNQKGEISLEIEVDKTIYQYDFSFTQKKVISESLKQIFPTKELIFSRYNYDTRTKYNLNNIGISPDILKNQIKPNASILSLALSLPNSRVKKLINTFGAYTNVKEIGHTDPLATLNNTLKTLESQPERKAEIIKYIRQFDIDLYDILIGSDSEGHYTSSSFGVHVVKGIKDKVNIPLIYESTGTKYLLSIIRSITESLASGVNSYIDEIDNNLHPLIMPKIIDLYINPHTNPKNAQLIISTHNTELLNYLDKQQIILVEKDKTNSSIAFKLSQIKGSKESDNFVKKYLSGSYGGIPNL